MEALGRRKTLIIRVRGCKNHVFGYVRFFVILGTILEVILELKMHPNPIVTHFGHRLWPIRPSFGVVEKTMQKGVPAGSEKPDTAA